MRRGLVAREKPWLKALQQRLITTANAISLNRARRLLISGAGHVLTQPVNAHSPMQRTNHHEAQRRFLAELRANVARAAVKGQRNGHSACD